MNSILDFLIDKRLSNDVSFEKKTRSFKLFKEVDHASKITAAEQGGDDEAAFKLVALLVTLFKYGVSDVFEVTDLSTGDSIYSNIDSNSTLLSLAEQFSIGSFAVWTFVSIATIGVEKPNKNECLILKIRNTKNEINSAFRANESLSLIDLMNIPRCIEMIVPNNSYCVEYIDWFFECVMNVCQSLFADRQTPVSSINLHNSKQKKFLLNTLGSSQEGVYAPFIHDYVKRVAAAHPQKNAVVYRNNVLSYSDLICRSQSVAYILSVAKSEAQKKEFRVLVFLNKTHAVPVALLGVFISGAVYVPVDVNTPIERIRFIVAEAGIDAVVSDEELSEFVKSIVPEGMPVINIQAAMSNPESRLLNSPSSGPEDIAYIIFTSGSTGQPKGVPIRHASLSNHVFGLRQYYEEAIAKKNWSGTFIAALGFDVSLMQLLFILTNGGTVHVIDDATKKNPIALANYIFDKKIDYTSVPPVLLEGLVDELEKSSKELPLLLLGAGGESVSEKACRRIMSLKDKLNVIVGYGPTESTIAATIHRVSKQDLPYSHTPIGRALPGYRLRITDSEGQLRPFGVAGELLIGGGVLSPGYLNSEELTRDKFIYDECPTQGKLRLYKTGDIVRYLPDGNLLFMGREDEQVKIRGIRVELGEIESWVKQAASVVKAAAKIFNKGAEKIIVVYIEKSKRTRVEIRSELKRNIPEAILPSAIVYLEEIPLTVNNKIDRNALPDPSPEDYMCHEFVKPVSLHEKEISSLACQLFRLEKISIKDDFSSMGFNSLLIVAFAGAINEKFSVDFYPEDVFKYKNISCIAGNVSKRIENQVLEEFS